MTAHYVKDDWTIVSPVLMTRANGKRHTSINLAAELDRVFREFEITEKMTTIVTDNAKNATKAADLTDVDSEHHPCFAHTLYLVVRRALDKIKESS